MKQSYTGPFGLWQRGQTYCWTPFTLLTLTLMCRWLMITAGCPSRTVHSFIRWFATSVYKFSYLFIFPLSPNLDIHEGLIHGFGSNWGQWILRYRKYICLIHTFLWFRSFVKFCLQTSATHANIYKTHVSEDFLIIFQLRLCHQLMDSSCLLFAIGAFPATHTPFSYPAACPLVVTCVRYSTVTKHFCSHWCTQFEFLNSSYELVYESKHCALRTPVMIIIHNFSKMVPGRSSEQRAKYILLIH